MRFDPNPPTGSRQFHLIVESTDGGEPIAILPTYLILAEDGQEIVSYSIEAHPFSKHAVRYDLPSPEAKELRVIVKTPSGWGEETFDIPLLLTPGP